MKKEIKLCIECKEIEAREWRSNFCEKCFTEILNSKYKEKEDV